MQKCPFQRADSLVCFFLFVFSDYSHFLLLSSNWTDEYLYNVILHFNTGLFLQRSRQNDSTFIRSQLKSFSLDQEKFVSFESDLSAPTRNHHNNYKAALRKTLIEPTLIKQHMAAKPLCKKNIVLSLSHSLCYTFCQRCWPFSEQNKVLHSAALSAHAPKWVGYLK